jgi:Asp/Glu/hydantoin racemase
MRIALVHITQMPEAFEQTWLGMVRASFEKVLRPGTEVVLRPVTRGLLGDNVLDFDNPYFAMRNACEVVEAVVRAERDGFDAAVVHCFADPGVAEARSIVSMPVFGPAEAALHLACQMGRRIAVIGTNMPGQLAQIEEQVLRHGLEGRLIPRGIRFDDRPFVEAWPEWLASPSACAEKVAQVARQCAEDGADVVVLGCAATSMFCSMVGLNRVAANGAEVPILDAVMAAMKTAEMAADIRKATGMPVTGRGGGRAVPSAEDWSRVRDAFGLPNDAPARGKP